MKYKNVIFTADTSEVIKALAKPQEWSALALKIDRIVEDLDSHRDWSITYKTPLANNSAFAIAQSVIKNGRTQSYVARGFPSCLKTVFVREQGRR